MSTKVDIKAILKYTKLRRALMVQTIIATQAREGIDCTLEQAEAAYDLVQSERMDRLYRLTFTYLKHWREGTIGTDRLDELAHILVGIGRELNVPISDLKEQVKFELDHSELLSRYK
jgi:hypothetical protein